MLVKEGRRSTYFLSKNLQIKLWHRRFGYTSNARVVGAFKLTNKIDILGKDYIEE